MVSFTFADSANHFSDVRHLSYMLPSAFGARCHCPVVGRVVSSCGADSRVKRLVSRGTLLASLSLPLRLRGRSYRFSSCFTATVLTGQQKSKASRVFIN